MFSFFFFFFCQHFVSAIIAIIWYNMVLRSLFQKPTVSLVLSLFLQVMVNGEKERVSLLVSRGSVDAVSQQMASHPQYLESFLRTQHYILHMDGPLPLPYRHYIAIMVSDLAFLSRIHPNSSPAVIMQPNVHKASFFLSFRLCSCDLQAAARHHCNYLVYLHSTHFLRVGGDPKWLQGLEAAPLRLRLLDNINKVLAHQPWLTACSHIQVQQRQTTDKI